MRLTIDIKEYLEEVGEETPDWSIDGSKLSVYRVPISKLFYNDENGRIATWINSDLDTESSLNYDDLDINEFNDKIHRFIKNANSSESFRKTYEDIKAKGQIRPGVILNDGRIVSGNRRFTVLRELYKETAQDKYAFFKCFVVDKNPLKEEDRKYIKTIEILTQFGVDEKVDYDPIARLVDVYNDLIGPQKIWTKEEYAKKLSLKKSDVDLMYNKAKIMADFLVYTNKPGKFYIARTLKLDGPIQELNRVYKNVSTDEWNRIRPLFYSRLSASGDRTRNIRDIIKIYERNRNKFDDLVSKYNEDIEKKESQRIVTGVQNVESKKSVKDFYKEEDKKDNNDDAIDVPNIFEPIEKVIVDAIYETEIEKKRQEKIKRVFSSLDEILMKFIDVYSLMNEVEKNIAKEKLSGLRRMLKDFGE